MNKTELLFDPNAYRHFVDLPVRFNDIDILGHVNNVVYLSLFDTGKAEYFRKVLIAQVDWRRVEQVIANINISFVNSAYYGEPIRVYTRCEEIGHKSFTLHQVMVNPEKREVKSVCDTVMVSYDPDTHTSTPVKPQFRELVGKFENRQFPLPENI